jgi:archaemetzincin
LNRNIPQLLDIMKQILAILIFCIVVSCNSKSGTQTFENLKTNTELTNKDNDKELVLSRKTTIAIQPFGAFDKALIEISSQAIRDIYGFNVIVLSSIPLPKSAYINIKSPRYRADSLIRIMKRNKPRSVNYVLGLTRADISTTKRDNFKNIKKPEYKYNDWGVFGLGFVNGPTCVVSTFRLKTSSQELFVERLTKICIHEIGHNLGLYHCKSNQNCIMRDAAETIKTIDNVEMSICKSCIARIQSVDKTK